MDPAMIHFALNAHLLPQGLVDIMHPGRKPRPISDLPQRRMQSTIGQIKEQTRVTLCWLVSKILRLALEHRDLVSRSRSPYRRRRRPVCLPPIEV